MKVLREVRLQIGLRADFKSVLMAPSVMPVTGSFTPLLVLRFMDLDVGQDVSSLVDYLVCLLVVRS